MKRIIFKENEEKIIDYDVKLLTNNNLIFSLDYQSKKPVLSLNPNIDEKLSRWIKELSKNIIIVHKRFKMISAVYSFRMQDKELTKILKPRVDKTTHPVIESAYEITVRKLLERDFIIKEFNNFTLKNQFKENNKSKELKKLSIQISDKKNIPDEIVMEAFILYNCLNGDGSFKETSSIFNELNDFIYKKVI